MLARVTSAQPPPCTVIFSHFLQYVCRLCFSLFFLAWEIMQSFAMAAWLKAAWLKAPQRLGTNLDRISASTKGIKGSFPPSFCVALPSVLTLTLGGACCASFLRYVWSPIYAASNGILGNCWLFAFFIILLWGHSESCQLANSA